MKKIEKRNDLNELSVRRSEFSARWMLTNYRLDDTYITESEGEVRDYIKDNTSLSSETVNQIVAWIADGSLKSCVLKLSRED